MKVKIVKIKFISPITNELGLDTVVGAAVTEVVGDCGGDTGVAVDSGAGTYVVVACGTGTGVVVNCVGGTGVVVD